MATLESTVDTGHEEMLHDAAMDYYGRRLATCSSDRSVKIFEVSEANGTGVQTQVAELKGHEGPVWQVAWANPKYGSILASCSYDRKVILWRDEGNNRWAQLYEHVVHDSSVNSVNWAPHELGLILACGSSDGSISILTYDDAGQTFTSEKIPNAHTIGCNAVSWAPYLHQRQGEDGSLVGGPVKRFVSGGCDNLVKVWRFDLNTAKWVEEAKLEAHSDWVRDVAWAPSLGVNKSIIASCSQDRRVIIWTNEGGSASGSTTWTPKTLSTFDDVVWHVSWSVSGNMLAVSGGDNKVTLWKETLDSQWVNITDVERGQSVARSVNNQSVMGSEGAIPVA